MTRPRRSRLTVPLVVVLVYAVLGGLATGAVWTNTLGAADRLDLLVERARLAIDPPPDREILPTIEVTRSGKDGGAGPPDLSAQLPGREDEATPRPKRKPVDVKLRMNPGKVFASQHTNDWCAPSGVQMVLAMHGLMDNSVDAQRRLANDIDRWESWRDSHNGGWGPAAIAEALAAHGLEGYEIRSYGNRKLALRDTARAVSETKSPVILIAWRGAHTWVMTGFRADADPTVFRNAKVSGAYIYDPWYPRVSTIWGPSDRPGAFQDEAEMRRNYLRWKRPEGKYADRDGKFLAIVPTVPMKDQPAVRS